MDQLLVAVVLGAAHVGTPAIPAQRRNSSHACKDTSDSTELNSITTAIPSIHREVRSGKQSLSTGVGLKNRGGKGESTANMASVRACRATGGYEGDLGRRYSHVPSTHGGLATREGRVVVVCGVWADACDHVRAFGVWCVCVGGVDRVRLQGWVWKTCFFGVFWGGNVEPEGDPPFSSAAACPVIWRRPAIATAEPASVSMAVYRVKIYDQGATSHRAPVLDQENICFLIPEYSS